MVLSYVPPPDASNPDLCGDHAIAFTTAVWSLKLVSGWARCLAFQIISLLSLPPEANCYSSKLHLRPHTSCLWLDSRWVKSWGDLKSRFKMVRSRLPVLRNFEHHVIAPMRFEWPNSSLIFFPLTTSQIWRFPNEVPTARRLSNFAECYHYIEVTY